MSTTIGNQLSALNEASNAGLRNPNEKVDQKDVFMKVFLKQLTMQDPMKPFDSSAMLQQMSQLTNLQATESLQKTIQTMNANMIQSQALEASQLVNRKVELLSPIAPLVSGQGLSGSVVLNEPSNDVEITITDENNKLVKTLHKSANSAGVLDFDWDGKVPDGKNEDGTDRYKDADSGFYKIAGTMKDSKGQIVSLSTLGTFKINSVALDPQNGAMFNVDGLGGIKLKDIIKIL